MFYNYWLATAVALVLTVQGIYTNADALECFNTKALAECGTQLEECLGDSVCSQELKKYNKCSFGASQEEASHIFNGYCFRRWEEKAVHSRSLIECLRKKCNLDYNSQIGVRQLFMCAQWTMFDNKFECGDACQAEMQILGDNLYTTPLSELYGTPFEDKQAQNVVDLIRESCIEQGQGKQMIYEEEDDKQNQSPPSKQQNSVQTSQL